VNSLVTVTPPMPVSDVERIAHAFAQSRMFGVSDPNAALSLCLLAQAEGQHPAIAFRDYSIIQGKPAKKAEAMQRDFLQSGGKIEWLELTDDCVKAKFSHPAGGTATIDWTMERARAAGLGGKDNWRKFPRQMLRSRVISEGVRTVCPMATSGLYVPEEVVDFDNRPAPVEQPANETPMIDIQPTPAPQEPAAREKLDGPHTSKTALRKAVNDIIAAVRKAESLTELDALKSEHKRTINQARRDWPALIDGDPRIEEDLGLKGEIERRREELTLAPATGEESESLSMLIETLETVTSKNELDGWFKLNWKYVEELDDEEQARITALADAKTDAMRQLAEVTA